MTQSDVYNETLKAQLGQDSPVTVRALIVPPSGGDVLEIYGWLESHTYNANKDAGNVNQRREAVRFITAQAPEISVYENYKINFPDSGKAYTVEYIEKDLNGAQVLWLY